jgi:hypothetical protein
MADHTQALDLLVMAFGVTDEPVARDELCGHIAGIGDRDGVRERKLLVCRRGLFGQVLRQHFAGKLVGGRGGDGHGSEW